MSSVIGIGNDFLKDEILYFKTQLNVEFQFTENPNKNDTFNRIFEFEIPLNFLKKSEFNPSKSYIDSISILEQKQLWEAQRQLGQKAGSIFLVLSAPRLDSDYIIPIIGSINTNLFYGTNQNNFILLRRLSNGKSIRIELPTKEKEKRMYLVTLIWSDSLTELGVDNRDSVIYHATWQPRTILRL